MRENVTININNKIQCKYCLWATANPFDCHCVKFRLKPNEVLFEGKNCPKYRSEEEFDADDEENDNE